MESKLVIKSIWEDEDLFEVQIAASNGLFSGIANCYTLRSEMSKLGELVHGFPKNSDDQVSFTTYGNNNFSYFSIFFKCKDLSGHVVARIKVAHIVNYSDGTREDYLSEFDMEAEPAAIDIFSSSIAQLAGAKIGEISAVLQGKT
jgi:hypothetical protein